MTKQQTAPQPKATGPQLDVSHAQQYGKSRYYPENETARIFCKLLKQDTLSPRDIELIKELGYRIMQVPRTTAPTEL